MQKQTSFQLSKESLAQNTTIPQDLAITQDLLSFSLNGKKVLIQKQDSGFFTIQSNYTPQAKSYDEARINENLENFASAELEENLTQRFKELKAQPENSEYISALPRTLREQFALTSKYDKRDNKKALVPRQKADEIFTQDIKEAQREARAIEKDKELKAQLELAQAQKDEALGKGVDEVTLTKEQTIPYQPLRDTKIILKDDVPPFEARFAIVNLQDIKPNFTKSNTQGRVLKQEAVIQSIIKDFKPELLFFREGGRRWFAYYYKRWQGDKWESQKPSNTRNFKRPRLFYPSRSLQRSDKRLFRSGVKRGASSCQSDKRAGK